MVNVSFEWFKFWHIFFVCWRCTHLENNLGLYSVLIGFDEWHVGSLKRMKLCSCLCTSGNIHWERMELLVLKTVRQAIMILISSVWLNNLRWNYWLVDLKLFCYDPCTCCMTDWELSTNSVCWSISPSCSF